MTRLITPIKYLGGVIALGGVVCIILAPLIGKNLFDFLLGVELLSYLGGILLIAGLGVATAAYAAAEWSRRRSGHGSNNQRPGHSWSETTLQYFQLFDHDLGRPLRRIAGKERELRAVLQAGAGVRGDSADEVRGHRRRSHRIAGDVKACHLPCQDLREALHRAFRGRVDRFPLQLERPGHADEIHDSAVSATGHHLPAARNGFRVRAKIIPTPLIPVAGHAQDVLLKLKETHDLWHR